MTRQEFYEKLHPFFTDEQIDNMDDYALEAAKDAHEGLDLSETYLHHIGREFVCNLLSDMTDDTDPIESITGICGGTLTAESYDALVAQMDEEW